jgi:hypothetical protein
MPKDAADGDVEEVYKKSKETEKALKDAHKKNAELEMKVAGTEQTLNYYSDRLAAAESNTT